MTEAQQDFKTIRQSINTYYSEKINEFGATARGVDWRDDSSQKLRFEQLIGALGPNQKRLMDETCTILDYGCGYGAFLSFIRERGSQARYFGFDIKVSLMKVNNTCGEISADRLVARLGMAALLLMERIDLVRVWIA